MNKQKKLNPDGSIKSRGISWTDFTFNPVGGCFHRCEWLMPDGALASCYANDAAESIKRQSGSQNYGEGFEHAYWHPERLVEPSRQKVGAKIFVASMADLMGPWVTDDIITQVLGVIKSNPHHTFQILTKNPPRLKRFSWPANTWVGISAPPTNFMGKTLTPAQQVAWLTTGIKALGECDAQIKWLSAEPLSFDIASILSSLQPVLNWCVIGAASNGRTTYQPESAWVESLLAYLDGIACPVFFKGNLVWSPWREEFPNE